MDTSLLLNRRRAIQLASGAALTGLGLTRSSRDTSAARGWCQADPLLRIAGQEAHVYITSSRTMLRSATDKMGVRLSSTIGRARAAGRAICQEAARRDADVVVLATGARRRADDAPFGKSVAYVLRHAPCDVIVLRFPAGSPERHVVPWIWRWASTGRALTDGGNEFGCELRLSRYGKPQS